MQHYYDYNSIRRELQVFLTENEKNNTVRAKIAEPILYSESNIKNNDDLAEVIALPKAVGSEKVDWSKGIERLKKWKEENENIVF